MTAEFISVGTEILMGYIVNTNAAFLAKECVGLGISCMYQSTVGDNAKRLKEAIATAANRCDIVIVTGGLGPTEDDLTKEMAAEYFGLELKEDEKALSDIKEYFIKRGIDFTENNRKQALVPEGAICLYNPNGTAPGIIIENEQAIVILLPGPPREMQAMWNDQVKPYLAGKTDVSFYSTMVKICGVSESLVEELIIDLVESSNPTVATYASDGEVSIRVTASAEDEKTAKKLVKPIVKDLKSRFGDSVFATSAEESLEGSLIELLEKNEMTISTAESCTAGLLAGRIVNVSGASEVFKEGVITYSNKAKRDRLGVKKSTLAKYSAVSAEVAKEMVKGLMALTKSDVGVSVTGYAGSDSEEEPDAGLVYIAVSVRGNIKVSKFNFRGNRNKVRNSAVANALTMTRMCLFEYIHENEK